ncbi:MAG: hypothetical protein A2268_11510 [Candidatus Raymondbacteria bacterium RifOxyA12_full_50_37]|uniref:histidine kinase n=1 Tax=Candidatus Raymondbacteria bacterium RIFOXYD12_FULL_49_13 TaxID=1817890 RepID=A0A1F7FAH1_UNCRA|nr:MAG: hypothetical protein A2268_11510 [Candidatus Raymondbacteria bacterium RifOxyA12_full_50_37]OGJ92395.1 MAG: hypothetical protein A2248_10635 [Candidatus Raymondbacteria bacterium RIFOXYA2_FULL_49_16]OGJ99376.1 MAG: hypothetical protein A2453_13695 [Candidatus Raymondbacteria bacterium RIFOXYC2_FULL_50_21]OGK03611.1 MAG: hypothetical protein A2519_02425 [Candidatus Raymondbacteria bacterium RIFOXYD12_FULL_49_13]OGP44288.1 MAG: hypothetical protein A2324_05025 [Candidatus Raymondbacteria 
MAESIVLAQLPQAVAARLRTISEGQGYLVAEAVDQDSCRTMLLNLEVAVIIMPYSIVASDERLLDTLKFYSNKVQFIYYAEERPGTDEAFAHPEAVGIIETTTFNEQHANHLIRNAIALYQRELKIEALNSAIQDNQAIANELNLKNVVLERERNFNQSIISSLSYGLMIIDVEGAIMLLNDMGKKIFGILVSDYFGIRFNEVVCPELREPLWADVQEVVVSGQNKEEPLFTIREDMVISYSISIIKDTINNITGLMVLGRDVTEEEGMKNQLFQAEKLATMGTMLSGIAHEIRNPLTIINARAQLALGYDPEHLNDKVKKALDSIEAQSKRCGEIINNLLDFSRKKVSGFTLASINDIIISSLGFLEYEGRSAGVEIVKRFDQDSVLTCDKSQMEQVFLNLFTNACDAMANKGMLTIVTESQETYVKIQVSDTGPGIPHELQKKIFDPFFTTKEAGKGTGLGLSIVYQIIQRHKGRFILQSKPGKGATFIILLPKR